MSSINNFTAAKSLNGINYINADDITTDTMEINDLTVNNTSTFNQPPTMSGANITTNTIPLTSINDNANICMLNKTNYFNYPTGLIMRSSQSGVGNFYISGADHSIGVDRAGTGVNYNWRINSNGALSLRSSTNSFKSWFINDTGGVIRYYNLGGTDSIKLLGDVGEIQNKKTIITPFVSNVLSNSFQVDRNYSLSGVVQSGHVSINNNGELIFNDGINKNLILEHTGTIKALNWSISSSGDLDIKSITYNGTANNIPLLNQNNVYSGSNTYNAGTTFNSSTYFNDPMYIYDNLDINGPYRNHLSITLDQPYNVLNASQSGANIFFDYTCQTTKLPYLDSGTDGYIFYVSTHPNGEGVTFQSNNDNRKFQPYNETYFNLNKGECAIIRSCNYQWIVFGDNVRCNGSLSQFITGLKNFETHPVCESSDMLTTYSLTTKAFCDATYHPLKSISGVIYNMMDLESNQTATGDKVFGGILEFTNKFACNNQPILLRNSTDTNNLIGFCGAYTTPKTTSIDGPLIEGFGGGLLALKQNTTQIPVLQWMIDRIYAFKTLFIENSAILETTNAHRTILLQVYANKNTTGYVFVDNESNTGYYDSANSEYKWMFDAGGNLTLDNNLIAYGGIDASISGKIINFGTNAPYMSGSNILTSSIPYTSINGYANYCYLNVGNFFNAQTTNLTNYIYALNNLTNTGGIFISNQGFIGYWNGLNNVWTINDQGQAFFQSDVTLGGDTEVNIMNVNTELQLKSGAVWTNNGGSIIENVGTIYNKHFTTISLSGSIPITHSGSKINISTTSSITLNLPSISLNNGLYFWITGDDVYSTIIQAASGDSIYNGSTSVSSFTLNTNQTVYIQVCNVGGSNMWVYDVFGSGGGGSSTVLSDNNVWTGTNAYNTSIPTTTLTPTTSTQLIPKGWADSNYVTIINDQNITTGIKRFYKAPMLGSETATGLHTKIGYQCGTYYTDATKRAVVIGNNALASNPTGINLVDYTVAIGPYAMQNYGGTVAQDQFTAVGAFALRAMTSGIGNTALGCYALQSLQYGSNNLGAGNASAGGLVGSSAQPCNQNFIMGSQSASGNGRKVLTEAFYTGATQTSATIVTPFMSNMRAGFQLYFYSSATPPSNNSQMEIITSYDHSTYTAVIANSRTIITGSYLGLFSTGTLLATATYAAGTTTGTTFTIIAWNSTAITSGCRLVYFETADLQKWAVVSSWNNTTKVLVVTTTITMFNNEIVEVYDVALTAQSRGLGISNNTTLGYFALANTGTDCARNLAIGTAALNGVGNEGAYDNRTYMAGATDNIGIGYGAGSSACIRNSVRNIWIGSSSGQNGPQIAPYKTLTETIALGYGVNTWENYQCCMANPQNYWYFPTNYKVCFGVTPNFNSSRTDYSETGARGVLQIVCGSQAPAQNAISCKAFNDAYYIINFQNSTGGIQGQIAGVNSTTVAYNTTSDQRIKDEIEDMESQLDNIKKVKARKFKWKESREDDNGFIAQEFYTVYPERNPLKNNDEYKDKLNPDGMILGLDYGRCTPYLWKGVSELIDIVRKQQEEINELKNILKNNNLV